MSEKPLIVACIPAFREESTIGKVVLETRTFVDKVVVLDDGSGDYTGTIAEALGAVVLRHDRNQGYGASISTLLKEAREMGADVAVTLDADGQHNPRQIPRVITPILEGEADIVIGSRFLNEHDTAEVPRYRKVGLKVITGLTSTSSYTGLTDAQCGFRAYSRKALEALSISEQGMGASTEILLKAKTARLQVAEVPVTIRYPKGVQRNHSANPLMHGFDVVMSTIKQLSMRHPLRFYGIPGMCAMLVAFIFWVWAFQLYTITGALITNLTLIAIGATIVGIILLMTGIMLWILISVVRERR